MKKETKTTKKEEDRWINVHDDKVMRNMGLFRPYEQAPRDENVWSKTPYERRLLQKVRRSGKGEDMHFHMIPKKTIPVKDKLIVYLISNKFGKSTHSFECWQHDIPSILDKFDHYLPKEKAYMSLVRKYVWNGKTYYPNELPFWQR